MQPLDPGNVVHQLQGVAASVELTAIEARPSGKAGTNQPLLEARVAPIALRVEDRVVAAMARVELPSSAPITAYLFSCTRSQSGMSIGMPRSWIRATVFAAYSVHQITRSRSAAGSKVRPR